MKPILFNTEMVKAILSGRKTTTRRIIKDVSSRLNFIGTSSEDGVIFNHTIFGHGDIDDITNVKVEKRIKAPYLPGDILYVRETWAKIEDFENYADVELEDSLKVLYKCDDYGKEHVFIDVGVKRWHPSIHMPKKLARIFLKVKDVRVERLQDITEEGARKEGCIDFHDKIGDGKFDDVLEFDLTAKDAFIELWNSTVNKKDIKLYEWEANPWIWVIEFEKLDNYKI